MAYRGPTVTLLRLGKEGLLIVAIDVEWRLVQMIITIIIVIIIIIISSSSSSSSISIIIIIYYYLSLICSSNP